MKYFPRLPNRHMSKSKLKAVLRTMEKEDLIFMVMELYDARKEAKEYLDFYAEPNEAAKLEEYKQIIINEFFPQGSKEARCRLSICRKAISNFIKLKVSPEVVADLMLCYAENGCKYIYEYWNKSEQFYRSLANNFDKTLLFIMENDLLGQFEFRIRQCLQWADGGGYNFFNVLQYSFQERTGKNITPRQK